MPAPATCGTAQGGGWVSEGNGVLGFAGGRAAAFPLLSPLPQAAGRVRTLHHGWPNVAEALPMVGSPWKEHGDVHFMPKSLYALVAATNDGGGAEAALQ